MSRIKNIESSWTDFDDTIINLLNRCIDGNVLEIGAGANPYLSKDLVDRYKITYTIHDIDIDELNKAEGDHFSKLSGDLSEVKGSYDFVFSKMVLEHIDKPIEFHGEVKRLLNEQGTACHFFATLFNMASLANKYLPEYITQKLQAKFVKRDLHQFDKFKAFYHWCYGPTKKNVNRYADNGFEIVSYIGFGGHNYFWNRPFLYWFEKRWSMLIVKYQLSYFCSNAIVVLKKSNLDLKSSSNA